MKKYLIQGGQKLSGTVAVSGSKNSTLPILAGVILLDGDCIIENVPNLKDIETMIRMLNAVGLRAELRGGNRVFTSSAVKVKHLVPYELVTKMRASFFVAGPILAKTGFVKIPLPGGCAIGSRPVDIHLKGFEALGATISQEHGFVEIRAKQLKAGEVRLAFPSVGATENLMMAAVFIDGVTVIHNAAREPEIVDLANFLNRAGAKISGAGSTTIQITGVRALRGVNYRVIPDRIEAGTLVIAGAITGSTIKITDCHPDDLLATLNVFRQMGVGLEVGADFINVKGIASQDLRGAGFETQPYPGFPTDMQSQVMALSCLARGTSEIRENLFENRYMHVDELRRLGADITIKEHVAIVRGVPKLSGCPVKTTDLRAGAALFVAGLAAEGETLIQDSGHLDRGYERLELKLKKLGANIQLLEKDRLVKVGDEESEEVAV